MERLQCNGQLTTYRPNFSASVLKPGATEYARKILKQSDVCKHRQISDARSLVCISSNGAIAGRAKRSIEIGAQRIRTKDGALFRVNTYVAAAAVGVLTQDAERRRPAQSSFRLNLCGIVYSMGS